MTQQVEQEQNQRPDQATAPPEKPVEERPAKRSKITLAQLVEKANAGSKPALRKLRQQLDKNPDLWQRASNLGAQAENLLISLVTGDDKLAREVIRRQLKQMRSELGGKSASPLVKLAIERVTATWLELQYLQIRLTDKEMSLPQMAFFGKQQDLASRRHMAALKGVAELERFAQTTPMLKPQNGARKNTTSPPWGAAASSGLAAMRKVAAG